MVCSFESGMAVAANKRTDSRLMILPPVVSPRAPSPSSRPYLSPENSWFRFHGTHPLPSGLRPSDPGLPWNRAHAPSERSEYERPSSLFSRLGATSWSGTVPPDVLQRSLATGGWESSSRSSELMLHTRARTARPFGSTGFSNEEKTTSLWRPRMRDSCRPPNADRLNPILSVRAEEANSISGSWRTTTLDFSQSAMAGASP